MKTLLISAILFFTMLFYKPAATAQVYLSNGDTLFIKPGEQIFIDADIKVEEATLINNPAAGIPLTRLTGLHVKIDNSAIVNLQILPNDLHSSQIGSSRINHLPAVSNFLKYIPDTIQNTGTNSYYTVSTNNRMLTDGNTPYIKTGNEFNNVSSFDVTTNMTLLPVNIIKLVAYPLQETVQVEWETAAETSNGFYEVQRSTDNNRFIKVGIVAAATLTSTPVPYGFIDGVPHNGINYYRIKSVGTNGAVKYSAIAKINYASKPGSISAYPNPVTDNKLTLEFKNKKAGLYHIILLNTHGALVYQKKMTHDGGNYKYMLALPPALARELYQMNIDGPDGTRTQLKIMIHY